MMETVRAAWGFLNAPDATDNRDSAGAGRLIPALNNPRAVTCGWAIADEPTTPGGAGREGRLKRRCDP